MGRPSSAGCRGSSPNLLEHTGLVLQVWVFQGQVVADFPALATRGQCSLRTRPGRPFVWVVGLLRCPGVRLGTSQSWPCT